jgi:HSP20 family protein
MPAPLGHWAAGRNAAVVGVRSLGPGTEDEEMTKSLKRREESQVRRSGAPWRNWRDEMDQFFETFMSSPRFELSAWSSPRMDVAETDEAIEVDTELPGFKPEEVRIEVDDNRLMITGEHEEEQQEDGNGKKYHRVERRKGSFSRSVWLPCRVDENRVEAQLKDGVLHVRLPKAETAKRKTIEVKG